MKVIQIGTGGFGKFWRKGLTEIDDLEVVGLVDINRDNLEDACRLFKVAHKNCYIDPYGNWAEDLEADFIIDSTPHSYHYRNAIKALRNDMNVIVVKPMSDDFANAKKMVEEANYHGRKVIVAQQLRYMPPCLRLREFISQDLIGKIVYANVSAFMGEQGGVRDKWYQPFPTVVEVAIHHFDLIRWILGLDANTVCSDIWNMPWNDNAWGKKNICSMFTMEDDVKVICKVISTREEGDSYPGNWTIEGTKGILKMENKRIYLNGKKIWPENDENFSGMDLAEYNKTVLKKSMDYFENGKTPSITGKDNLKSLAMVFGSIESYKKKKNINLINGGTDNEL